MKIALLTSDNREPFKQYEKTAPWFGTAPEALLQGFALLPGVEVHVITCAQRRMTSPAKLAPNIFFHSLHVPKIGWLRTGYQGCVRAIRRALRTIQPDVVHGQGTERECALGAAFSGFPNVVTIHGNMRLVAQIRRSRPFSFAWLAARLEAFALPRTDGVVCITRYTQDAVAALARRTWLLPNAVDSSFFEIQPQPLSPARLLVVANVEVRKNQNAFIRALDALEPAGRFEVWFFGTTTAGDAYGREFLELVAARPWCHFGGFINREELRQHFVTSKAAFLPTLEDNCPMVVLEAMAAGVPVAAANVGGVPELIRNGENGLLFDPHDPTAMRNAVDEILSSAPNRWLGPAREEARRRFHPRNIAERHVEIYREVIAARRAGAMRP